MRDLETFRLALRAAETGNLVFATLHTSWAARTIARIIDMFPWDEQDQIRSQLSDSLISVIWQDLIKRKDWKGRVLASELLVNNTWIANMIRKDSNHLIQWAMETWAADWMYTMEKSLEHLTNKWII
jgi:twitching motility protein PilT